MVQEVLRYLKSSTLQALRHDAPPRAIPEQELHDCLRAVHEEEQQPRQRVLLGDLGRYRVESVEALSHVNGVLIDEHPRNLSSKEH